MSANDSSVESPEGKFTLQQSRGWKFYSLNQTVADDADANSDGNYCSADEGGRASDTTTTISLSDMMIDDFHTDGFLNLLAAIATFHNQVT